MESINNNNIDINDEMASINDEIASINDEIVSINDEMVSIDIIDNVSIDIIDIHKNDKNIIFFKIVVSIIFILINFPIIFCDLYYAINDNTCVNQKMEKLAVNMYYYLIFSGIYSVIITFISLLFIFYFEKIKTTKCVLFNILFLYISGLFNISWNIIGSLIFWHYMDNNKCSNEVFNYLFASLIIKLVFSSIILFKSNKNE